MSRVDTGPFCGALGCSDQASHIVDHPEYGRRAVCGDHAQDFKVIRDV